MSGTRSKNLKAEYNLEKKQNANVMEYLLNSNYAEQNTNTRMFNIGTGPSKMDASNMSHNHIDIESKLRGIRSNDLENGSFDAHLKEKSFKSMPLFDNRLREEVYLPNPIIHHTNVRPGFHNI